MCGTLRASDAGKKAVLMGWVNKRRDHGNLLFIDLRDRTGVTQVVVNVDRNAAIHEKAGDSAQRIRHRRDRHGEAARRATPSTRTCPRAKWNWSRKNCAS